MSSKHLANEVVAPGVVGLAVLALSVMLALDVQLNGLKLLGFLAGLLGGYISASSLQIALSGFRHRRLFRVSALVTSPFGGLLIAPVSPEMAVGYFGGAAITFSFCWSSANLSDVLRSTLDKGPPCRDLQDQ
jgi:hypothetical protein